MGEGCWTTGGLGETEILLHARDGTTTVDYACGVEDVAEDPVSLAHSVARPRTRSAAMTIDGDGRGGSGLGLRHAIRRFWRCAV
eukprot:scaffold8735_cov129-Isochrysis_galbana.AAC.3